MKPTESPLARAITHRPLARREFLAASAATAGGFLLAPNLPAATSGAASSGVALQRVEPWAPHAKAAPKTARRSDAFAIEANGTRTCAGGWHWLYHGIVAGQTYDIAIDVEHEAIGVPRDMLNCLAIWGAPPPTQARNGAISDYLLPVATGAHRLRFSRRVVAPPGATQLTLRATLRWTAEGKTVWQLSRVRVADEPLPVRAPVRISVVTGNRQRRNRSFKTVADNVAFFSQLCEDACRRDQPQLLVLPEVALHYGLSGDALDLAFAAPGPETEAFAEIARRHRVRIAVGMFERERDAVYNSLVLVGPTGAIEGRYRKVHLAHGEDLSGVLPGDEFPVFATEIGRFGCNICMDSMTPEAARMVGLGGADFLLLPIMGDFRADRWDFGPPVFDEDRWRTILRAHALDNQLCLVVARNGSRGSCIVNRRGEFLAWNDGEPPFVTAEVVLDDGYRAWEGSCFRDSAWLVRRPHLYGKFADAANCGSVQ